ILDLAQEIDKCPISASFTCQREFASWDLYGKRNKIFSAIQLKVADFQCNRKLGDRIAQHERIFKLTLLVGTRELGKDFLRVVSLPVLERSFPSVGECDFDFAELAVRI